MHGTELEDIMMAKAFMPNVDLDVAVDMMKFEEVNDETKRKETSSEAQAPSTSVYDNYDGTEPVNVTHTT